MTTILLDTNVVLRLIATPDRIATSVRNTLADQTNELFVSAASAWEVAIKTRIGRLDGGPLLAAWAETVANMGATDLGIDSNDAIMAGQLNWDHKDPFDRMIISQAVRQNFTITTTDGRMMHHSPAPVIDARP